jgi:hypothetical protein
VPVPVTDGAEVEPEAQPVGVGEVAADDAAQRTGKPFDQRRHGDDLVAHDQRGLLLHVDDFQVDVAAKVLVANAAHRLNGFNGLRGRAIDVEGQRPAFIGCRIGHVAALLGGRSCRPTRTRSVSDRSPTIVRIGSGSLRTTVGTARI